jgi:hypothetical protein
MTEIPMLPFRVLTVRVPEGAGEIERRAKDVARAWRSFVDYAGSKGFNVSLELSVGGKCRGVLNVTPIEYPR